MKTTKKIKKMNNAVTEVFEALSRIILSLLLGILLIVLLRATIGTFFELRAQFDHGVHEMLKVAMVNSLGILAILEVFKTGLAYFASGRVKVTYIIDTVIVVVLTELMIFWFKDVGHEKILLAIALILSLIVARILTIRFSPGEKKSEQTEVTPSKAA